MSVLKNDWALLLESEFKQPYYLELKQYLKEEYRSSTIYPDMYEIFTALHLTPYANTKVVILGQDPYHGAGQAHGLSFSVKSGITPPPSLQNIFKELQDDLGCQIPNHGSLIKWAEQGVLMLNTVLTVRANSANSHKGIGWERFTDRVISLLNQRNEPVVFILWGRHAQAKKELITGEHHYIINSPHPSPFSAHTGFYGSKPFSKTNNFLRENGRDEIDWQIDNE